MNKLSHPVRDGLMVFDLLTVRFTGAGRISAASIEIDRAIFKQGMTSGAESAALPASGRGGFALRCG